jgi:hypothetical protein
MSVPELWYSSSPYRALRRDVRRALLRFRHTTPHSVAHDLIRSIRLHCHDPKLRILTPRPERIVVSMTTIPERVHKIAPALRSVLDQSCPADRVLLSWPSTAKHAPYPKLPRLPGGVEVIPCEDKGPATKFLAAHLVEPRAAIVVVDDDVIYPVDFLSTLLEAHRCDPMSALGWRGWRLQPGLDPRDFDHVFATAIREATLVDVLLGTWGYLVPPGALDGAVHDFRGWPAELRFVDDVWISGHLARRRIPRRVVAARGVPIETTASSVRALTDGPNRSGHNDRVGIKAFSAWW